MLGAQFAGPVVSLGLLHYGGEAAGRVEEAEGLLPEEARRAGDGRLCWCVGRLHVEEVEYAASLCGFFGFSVLSRQLC